MPELLLELFSEEIPARMQARAADDLSRLVTEALAPLAPATVRGFSGARRIAVTANVAAGVAASRTTERGPRRTAPEQALAGFLRKHGATRENLREEGDFWALEKISPGIDAAALIGREIPGLLRRFPWPKSMRWGGTSAFTWVRPLRRILCILDGETVPFDLRETADDGHGLASGNITQGHRFLAPKPFAVGSVAEWQVGLRERKVIADAAERRALIEAGLLDLAQRHALTVVEDSGLLDEVAGLVEWPVVLLGRIDTAYMDLPPEVMQVSMRVNQRYFSLRDAAGKAAPYFAFVANIFGSDGGKTIVSGNERVLRARFADARHFWDLDRKQTLESRVPALDKVTFLARAHLNITVGQRVLGLAMLAREIAPLVGAAPDDAEEAAKLAKADLVTGMVGEFPELQGVMGRYYARHDRKKPAVADAIRDHYAPRGPGESVPRAPVSVAVALADKILLLAEFFGPLGEHATGSGDPFGLRRAALGVIRIVRENQLHLHLRSLFAKPFPEMPIQDVVDRLMAFVLERLRVQLRAGGARHDILDAVLGQAIDDDVTLIADRAEELAAFLSTPVGADLLAGYRRAANILRIENKRDGRDDGAVDDDTLDDRLFEFPEEVNLLHTLRSELPVIHTSLTDDDEQRASDRTRFRIALSRLATLRSPLDSFFDKVTVNDPRPELRRNRLRLLSRVRAAMHLAADFSRLEG